MPTPECDYCPLAFLLKKKNVVCMFIYSEHMQCPRKPEEVPVLVPLELELQVLGNQTHGLERAASTLLHSAISIPIVVS